MLGIPSDPRLIEVLAYFTYLIPVTLYLYWPSALRLSPQKAAFLRLISGIALALIAFGLALMYPAVRTDNITVWAPLVVNMDKQPVSFIGKARLNRASGSTPVTFSAHFDGNDVAWLLTLAKSGCRDEKRGGIVISTCVSRHLAPLHGAPSSLRFEQLRAITSGQMIVGLNPRRHPGPYDARWFIRRDVTIQTVQGGRMLLDAQGHNTAIVTLSGGGLRTPRTITVTSANHFVPIRNWRVLPAYVDGVLQSVRSIATRCVERHLWAVQLPILLAIIALTLAASAYPLFSLLRLYLSQQQREST